MRGNHSRAEYSPFNFSLALSFDWFWMLENERKIKDKKSNVSKRSILTSSLSPKIPDTK